MGSIFNSLDLQNEGALDLKEVAFLDDWPHGSDGVSEEELAQLVTAEHGASAPRTKNSGAPQGIEYWSLVPGPGAYTVGATDVRAKRAAGAVPFASRGDEWGKIAKEKMDPGRYCPSLKPTTQRKPAWTI